MNRLLRRIRNMPETLRSEKKKGVIKLPKHPKDLYSEIKKTRSALSAHLEPSQHTDNVVYICAPDSYMVSCGSSISVQC